MDQKHDRLRENLDRVLLLLASEPRPGFEAEFEELARREVDRLLRPESEDEGADE
jgi:hypothetical protein